MSKEFYFISDLHIGGDKKMNKCEFEKELILFLKELENKKDSELIMVGDTFGFWEITKVDDDKKMDGIIKNHLKLFSQFKKTGSKIKITILAGNHDHDLVCYPEYSKILKKYNLNLETKEHIIRKIDGKKIYIEHGSQNDEYNRVSEFGSKNAKSLGYFVTKRIIEGVSRSSEAGEKEWMKDIKSVYPNEEIPRWMFSNYFYKEMNPVLRYLFVPFLVLFGVSLVFLVLSYLDTINVISQILGKIAFSEVFPVFGRLIDLIVNLEVYFLTTLISVLIIFSIPLILVGTDVRKTLKRYGLWNKENLKLQKESDYISTAKRIFKMDRDVLIYVYGHTHCASLKKVGNRYVINTGTWTKKLKRIKPKLTFLPAVYYPSYELTYFKISKPNKNIEIDNRVFPKKFKSDLTFLEKFATLLTRKKGISKISEKTII